MESAFFSQHFLDKRIFLTENFLLFGFQERICETRKTFYRPESKWRSRREWKEIRALTFLGHFLNLRKNTQKYPKTYLYLCLTECVRVFVFMLQQVISHAWRMWWITKGLPRAHFCIIGAGSYVFHRRSTTNYSISNSSKIVVK